MGQALYVSNISLAATEEDLRKLFGVCGKVTYLHLVKDSKTGAFVGCAYVTMASEAEAKDAVVTLDDALLIDRTITVKPARPRQPQPRRGSGPSAGKRRRP
jgi:RNA recognition motif-containing protein